jgi:hypothetical protein
MNKKNQQANTERQTVLAAIRAKQTAADRRRKYLIFGATGLVLAALVGTVAAVVTPEAQKQTAVAEIAKQPIEGVQVYEDLSRNHVQAPVNYKQSPGVGGDHSPMWTNCGIYTVPVDQTRAVHSLEHGAVWLTYRQDLPAGEIQRLTDLVGKKRFVLLSPNADQSSPVVASAWGTQLSVDSASDSRLETFLSKYIQGEQTPEPGAPCTGGVDG